MTFADKITGTFEDNPTYFLKMNVLCFISNKYNGPSIIITKNTYLITFSSHMLKYVYNTTIKNVDDVVFLVEPHC